MEECTIKAGEEPCIEIVGDPKAEYILAIDPNMSAAETSDHFAMCLIKIAEKTNSDTTLFDRAILIKKLEKL